jgi:hypothetical protein
MAQGYAACNLFFMSQVIKTTNCCHTQIKPLPIVLNFLLLLNYFYNDDRY